MERLDAAVVWGPIGGYFARRIASPELVVLPLKSEPGVRMDFGVAMGVRQGEKAWRSLIQQALDQSRDEIVQILRQYNVPMVDDKGELDTLRRHYMLKDVRVRRCMRASVARRCKPRHSIRPIGSRCLPVSSKSKSPDPAVAIPSAPA